ncbi:MAG: DNA mismatch repair protein [Mariniblastus sp.]|nr:DNA mismatch repair protein [Mariniblastus sp.]
MSRTKPGQPATTQEVLDFYVEKQRQEADLLQRAAARWSTFSFLRGGSFLVFLACLVLGLFNLAQLFWLWYGLAAVCLVAFLVVAFLHEGIHAQIKRSRLLAEMHSESIARIKREWSKIKTPPVEIPRQYKAVAFDLDLVGESSLYQLLGTARTPLGIETLCQWILEGASSQEIEERQTGVAELAVDYDYRERFRLLCARLHTSQSGPSRFIDWSQSPHWFQRRSWLLWLSRLTSVATLAGLFLLLTGLVAAPISGSMLLGALLANFFLSVFFAGGMHDVFNRISSHQNEIAHYVELFDMVGEFESESPFLQRLQDKLKGDGDDVRRHVGSLSWLTWLANIRRDGILFLAYLVLEFMFLWDAHVLNLLENWKSRHGSKAERWFAALGQWEAMLALSKLRADHPEWVFPTLNEPAPGEQRIESLQLGHPLLDDSRVPNDVTVGPAGTVLLVTGSNMSGKSTLLRSIGVNVTLAQMGSVVCAQSMKLATFRIETSMRIVDSLSDGVSFFMAELKRLKEIVDKAKQQNESRERSMLFLLDEILQGTNSRERSIAVSRVVRKLIDENAIGAISTHDLELAETNELSKACRTVHFSEQFIEEDGRRRMTFDYRMRQGIAETTNALKLLEIVGLGE